MDPVSAAAVIDETRPLLADETREIVATVMAITTAIDLSPMKKMDYQLDTPMTTTANVLEDDIEHSTDALLLARVKSAVEGFDPEGDPDNPRDWPARFQWSLVLILAFMAFTVTFNCISVVPVASHIVRDLEGNNNGNNDNTDYIKAASVLLVTIWELGEAAGPLAIAPLAETASWGRYVVLNAATILFVITTVAAAVAPSTNFFIAARGLNGVAVATNVLSPAIVGDLFPPARRGSAMALVQLAPLLGGAIGPAIGGVLADTWGLAIRLVLSTGLATIGELLFLLAFRETYAPAILYRRKLQRQEKDRTLAAEALIAAEHTNSIEPNGSESNGSESNETGNHEQLLDPIDTPSISSGWTHIREAVLRPAVVLADSFVLVILALFGSVVFSYFYALSVSLPDILETRYGLSSTATGSAFLAFSAGSAVSVAICNSTLDRIYVYLARREGGDDEGRPEFRLPLSGICGFLLPFALAGYGWAAEYRLPLPVLLSAVALLGATLLLTFIPLAAYVVDAFGLYAASAMTGLLVTRCLCGTFLPLTVAPLVDALGYGWAFSILAGLCLALAPIPILVLRYGQKWRQRSRYTRDE